MGAASPWETSQNFAFNNRIYDSTSSGIDSQTRGSANYFSQNFFLGNASNLGSTSSALFFNHPVAYSSLGLTFADWQSHYFWYGADSSLTADPNQNGSSNLMEYAFGQNPLAVGIPPSLPFADYDSTTANGPWATLTYRHNKNATDLTYETWSSNDLKNWDLQIADGINLILETVNTDVDGDGSTELCRTRMKLSPTETKRFFKLQIRKN